MLIEVDYDKIRSLLEEINKKIFLLEGEEDIYIRQKIANDLLEDNEGELKQLFKIFKVDI